MGSSISASSRSTGPSVDHSCRTIPPGGVTVRSSLAAGGLIPAPPTYMNLTVQTHWKILVNVDSGVASAIGSLFNDETGNSFIRTLGGRTDFEFAPRILTCRSRFYDLLRVVATDLGFEGRKFPFRHSVQKCEVNLRFRLYQDVLAVEVVRSVIDIAKSDDLIEKTSLWSQMPIADLVLNVIGLIQFPKKGFKKLNQKPKVFTCSRIVGDAASLPVNERLGRDADAARFSSR